MVRATTVPKDVSTLFRVPYGNHPLQMNGFRYSAVTRPGTRRGTSRKPGQMETGCFRLRLSSHTVNAAAGILLNLLPFPVVFAIDRLQAFMV